MAEAGIKLQGDAPPTPHPPKPPHVSYRLGAIINIAFFFSEVWVLPGRVASQGIKCAFIECDSLDGE